MTDCLVPASHAPYRARAERGNAAVSST